MLKNGTWCRMVLDVAVKKLETPWQGWSQRPRVFPKWYRIVCVVQIVKKGKARNSSMILRVSLHSNPYQLSSTLEVVPCPDKLIASGRVLPIIFWDIGFARTQNPWIRPHLFLAKHEQFCLFKALPTLSPIPLQATCEAPGTSTSKVKSGTIWETDMKHPWRRSARWRGKAEKEDPVLWSLLFLFLSG